MPWGKMVMIVQSLIRSNEPREDGCITRTMIPILVRELKRSLAFGRTFIFLISLVQVCLALIPDFYVCNLFQES